MVAKRNSDRWTGRLIEVKSGWMHAGRRGAALSGINSIHGQDWIAVLWFDSEDPSWHKASGLIVVGGQELCPSCGDLNYVRAENIGGCTDKWHRE